MSPLVYRLLADLVVLFHAAYVLFVVVGLLLIVLGAWRGWRWVRSPLFRWTHLAAISVVVLESWVGIMCPLTVWEQRLRELGGQESYRGDFIGNLVHELMFFEAPTWVFTLVYTIFAMVVAATLFAAPPRRDWRSNPVPADRRDQSAAGPSGS